MMSAIAGDVTRGIGILNNELYRGRVVWNRVRWVTLRGRTDRAPMRTETPRANGSRARNHACASCLSLYGIE